MTESRWQVVMRLRRYCRVAATKLPSSVLCPLIHPLPNDLPLPGEKLVCPSGP